MEQRPRVVRDIIFMYVMLYNMLRTHQGEAHRVPTPEAALQNEQVVYLSNDNYRNPSRVARLQQELLKDDFSHVGALAVQ